MDVELQLNGQIIFYPHNADRQIDSKIDTTYFILCNCKEFN